MKAKRLIKGMVEVFEVRWLKRQEPSSFYLKTINLKTPSASVQLLFENEHFL
ncbi:hypothetical protein [Pedobacter frigiditerrae]|uniref:hypothetical protein n=1 Tax=Pedobacter frigiditerrae TaxID=2530452 RepID=UPI00292F00F0|nr:hypothetical protein [Pedobacter frigiditerrae]